MRDSGRPRLWAAQDGNIAVRLAILVPLLVIAALAVRDYGGAFLEQKTLGTAADAGTRWGRNFGYDPNGIVTAARAATSLPAVTVSPASLCGCPGRSGIIQYECHSSCPDGSSAQPYIVVTASQCYSTTFSWPGVSYCSSGDTQCFAAGCTPKQIVLSAQSIGLR